MHSTREANREKRIKLPRVMPTIALMDRDDTASTVDVRRDVLDEILVVAVVIVVEVMLTIVINLRRVGIY